MKCPGALQPGRISPEPSVRRASVRARVKVSEGLRLLAEDGWVLDRVRGSHRQYRHPDRPGIVTEPGKPRDELHPKTRNSILRQAGLR